MELTIFCCSLVLFASCVTGQGYYQPKKCPPLCRIFCEYGNVMQDGCPICQCNLAPSSCCPRNSIPVFPERRCYPWGSLGSQCGLNAFCSTAPRSLRTGICCRRSMGPTETRPNIDIDPLPVPLVFIRPCPQGTVIDEQDPVCHPLSVYRQCRNGAFCNGGPADGTGHCCRRIPQNVHCPKVTTKCWYNQISDYCTSLSCPYGYKCCKQACGKRCVPDKGGLYIPEGRGTRYA